MQRKMYSRSVKHNGGQKAERWICTLSARLNKCIATMMELGLTNWTTDVMRLYSPEGANLHAIIPITIQQVPLSYLEKLQRELFFESLIVIFAHSAPVSIATDIEPDILIQQSVEYVYDSEKTVFFTKLDRQEYVSKRSNDLGHFIADDKKEDIKSTELLRVVAHIILFQFD
ncbi:hypothetical protein BDA99DRAFT_570136 [Phascolomyces articulosus]|uniref:Uncharacterized protein n=1 Tax=Phascolomyces articulosus TaxID=60185 RepID=A0AAD5KEM0_9FUNG|nr:hypothetical protein BDA99DRAFT_570136 [Phascolomyces articulosus]